MNKFIADEVKNLVIKTIRAKVPQCRIIVFGSRIKGNARKYSDLDVALDTGKSISFKDLSALNEVFSQSDIPFKIDLVDYKAVDDDFRKIIDKTCEVW